MSKSQLDKLGVRLARMEYSADELRMLDEYRRSFAPASDAVLQVLRSEFSLSPTARPAKSTAAIVEKLVRQRTRLTQIQDIAGCRIVVSTISEQKRVAKMLVGRFPGAQMFDRVTEPNHGYRAIHVVVQTERRAVEIQIRTELQHMWAALSEKAADRFDHALKYGGGPERIREALSRLSTWAHDVDWKIDLVQVIGPGVEKTGDTDLQKLYRQTSAELAEDRRILSEAFAALAEDPDELLDTE
ncbi:hypothetical protein SNE35_12835 [Paucibacter sp. R3-3]|uniref:RelA/SpoT domain-containing protein n=1 Tax=Roseateles agri TaxID=3098619 RepID=A0ABU5DGI5_9BURK|nr:hypothetical protein [Paucibacter sp. R3-3]MDY0745400.1 hypothetical protein [Paucibacter sp. R3-3]